MTTSTADDAATAAQVCGDRPAVLRGAGRDWPVYTALGEARLREFDDRPVVAQDAQRRAVTVPLREILDELRAEHPRGLYLRDQLVSEFEPGLWNLVPREVRRLNWLLALPTEMRPDWVWLMIGGAGSGSPLHVDTMASSAWNLLCSGRKRWSFHPPGRAEELRLLPPGCADAPGACDGESVTLVQEAGDIVVTPSGWAHEVRNLTGTVSVTANFVNASNLAFAKRYFDVLGDMANGELLTAVGAAFGLLGEPTDDGSRVR
ncbi:cupin-like domain-containing protein [Streptomyces sp. NPDC057287]|uniref:cupin-like domain-containing protein n=1 Tax=Streptomyces sp. NPDC057287 TaxID=3346086 RepID=UPI00363EB2F3